VFVLDDEVMGFFVGRLRLRRSRYAFYARRNVVLRSLSLPARISLLGGICWERRAYVFWRVRLPLWIVLGAAGWLLASGAGVVLGLVAAVVMELLFSYRPPGGLPRPTVVGGPPGPGQGPTGVREPRWPRPTGGAGSAGADPTWRSTA